MKLGSLFDGIGGFPLVAAWYGIEPVWSSEIEPDPISITKRHFPNMYHLGDITKINGAKVDPVDIITFGSPCQDLSVAGKRAGLAGERSGLFGEAIRIIEEMRTATNGLYPSWAIWENVPGALLSNDGLDFRAVLQSFAAAELPMPVQGKWADAGMVRGYRCDFGWRILDAKFWGVPQRRKRIFLVADFRGRRAEEVLFKPEGMPGYFAAGGEAREEIAGSAENSVGKSVYGFCPDNSITAGGISFEAEKTATLSATKKLGVALFKNHAQDSRVTGPLDVSPTLSRKWGTGGGNVPLVAGFCGKAGSKARGIGYQEEIAPTIRATQEAHVFSFKAFGQYNLSDTSKTLMACDDITTGDLVSTGRKGVTVRRLTPTECERLQGFPDGWTAYGHDGKKISDSARYRALGNSVALPCVEYFISGIAAIEGDNA